MLLLFYLPVATPGWMFVDNFLHMYPDDLADALVIHRQSHRGSNDLLEVANMFSVILSFGFDNFVCLVYTNAPAEQQTRRQRQ